ncbi:MAG: hydroxyphenylacetyl-CoA thioesterase PaaI [Woeseiaceae bacterium]|nr:hydroxyphenylacetyl-CoA thioesterase PaaI [Woeseiaceae bacterium]
MSDLDTARRCADTMYAADAASRALGIDIEIPKAGQAIASMRVRDDMVNGFDVCHGGLIFTLADTAFAFACNAYDRLTVAAAANIEFLKPARRDDVLTATAVEEHRGGRSGVYSVEVLNQDDERVALFRGRSASRAEGLLQSDTESLESGDKA